MTDATQVGVIIAAVVMILKTVFDFVRTLKNGNGKPPIVCNHNCNFNDQAQSRLTEVRDALVKLSAATDAQSDTLKRIEAELKR